MGCTPITTLEKLLQHIKPRAGTHVFMKEIFCLSQSTTRWSKFSPIKPNRFASRKRKEVFQSNIVKTQNSAESVPEIWILWKRRDSVQSPICVTVRVLVRVGDDHC